MQIWEWQLGQDRMTLHNRAGGIWEGERGSRRLDQGDGLKKRPPVVVQQRRAFQNIISGCLFLLFNCLLWGVQYIFPHETVRRFSTVH